MALISNNPSSSNTSKFKHDVFLSFRGEDTRYNFTTHLHTALCDKQIQTYIDYKLERGDEISPSLLKAIEESKISVIIFSKDYASSGWCLQELVKILECKKSPGQIVIPVFYNVEPTDVRNQTGTFGDAFKKHDQQQSLDQVQRWKDALKEAANLSGWDSSTIKDEAELIKKIVEDILKRLNEMSSSDSKGLVGIDSKIEQIVSWLETEDVRSVGIWGIGGIGKTTLAEAVFDRISSQFEGSYFIRNIRERSEQSGGLNHMQEELLSTVLKDENVNLGTAIVRGTFIRDRLGCKKLLIVFDDVNGFRQINTLIGGFDCLNSQSRIIITTRDKQVLRSCGASQVYEVQELFHHEALELFRQHAFKKNLPTEDYMELSERVCEYTGGVPLALEVLGSFLCDKSEQIWASALSKLKRIPNKDIQNMLKISYDGLNDEEEQTIFLDIACFFKGKNKDYVINILNACGFSAEYGINVLSDKSLISLSNDNIIIIHDLLQTMAREIVRQECIVEPGKRSRLWNYDDIYNVLTKDKGSEIIEAIFLDMSSSNARDINLTSQAFVKMEKLRLLKFYYSNVWDNRGNKVHVHDEGFEFVFNELKYLHWYGFPLKSLQSNFQSESLVIFEMPNSNVEELWSGFPPPVNLKRIDIRRSKQLTSITNCSGLKSLKEFVLFNCSKLKRLPELPNNLETLSIEGCESLVEIPSSFKYLNKVKYLDFSDCKSLESIPDLRGWKSLKELRGWRCSKLKMLPEVPNNIESLDISAAHIEEFPPSFEDLHSLKYLDLSDCSMLKSLPSSICKSKSLKSIDVGGTAIREIPPSISCLKRLESLNLSGCKGEDGVGLILPPLSGLDNLKRLFLFDYRIKELPDSLGCLTSLRLLNLAKNKFESIPGSIINLSETCLHIYMNNCERIKVLPKLRNWNSISAVNCTSLEELPSPFLSYSFNGVVADFTNCLKLNQNSLNYFLEGIVLQMQRLLSIENRHRKTFGIRRLPASICYPENDIPEWFSFRSTGSFIDVKLPQDCFNYNFICLALSVVVTISDPDPKCDHQGDCYRRYNLVEYEHIVKSKDGDRNINRFNQLYSLFEVPSCGPHYMKSNHVIIGFGYCFDRELCDDEFSFRFYVKHVIFGKELDMEHINVVKCGVHLIFGQNLETTGDDDEFSSGDDDEFSSLETSGDDDEFSSGDDAPQEIETYRITPRDQDETPEDEPHPKRLKHTE